MFAIVAILGFLLWRAFRPATGEAVSIPADYETHIQEGTPPGQYPSDPPAGGVHYANDFPAQFYQETDVESLPEYPEGYLVHNLEHGYVIFWYNCQANPSINCTDMQNAIKQVIEENNSFKVIGFPWPSQKEPLVMTSWGRILRQDKVDLEKMRAFYKGNVNKGPEKTVD